MTVAQHGVDGCGRDLNAGERSLSRRFVKITKSDRHRPDQHHTTGKCPVWYRALKHIDCRNPRDYLHVGVPDPYGSIRAGRYRAPTDADGADTAIVTGDQQARCTLVQTHDLQSEMGNDLAVDDNSKRKPSGPPGPDPVTV